MDNFPLAPLSPLRISSGAPVSSNQRHYPKRPSPTSFPGPTGIGAPFVNSRLRPLFPDSERDDLFSKTEGVYNVGSGIEADYFGAEMMNRRRVPMHDSRLPRFNDNSQFTSPSRHYVDLDQRGMQREIDQRGMGDNERRQYAERRPSPPRGVSYYDGRTSESSQQYTPRRYYDEPDTYRQRETRDEMSRGRLPLHHQLNGYESADVYHRPTPASIQDRWSGDSRSLNTRRSPHDYTDNFGTYDEYGHPPTNNLRRATPEYDRLPTTNPRHTPVEYDREYQERAMRPLSPPAGRASSPGIRRSKSREPAYNRSESDLDERKTPVREHFFPHHRRRLKGYHDDESDDPSSSSSSATSSEVPNIRRSRSNRRKRNSGRDIPEALPVFDPISSSDSSDSDARPIRHRSRSKSRFREESRAVMPKSPRRPSSDNNKSKSHHNHYVIDLSSVPPAKRHVTFSPSTDIDYNNSVEDLSADGSHTGYGKNGDNYAQRMADAALLKEQSEARHQILQEIRQAMEMRDLSTDESDQEFWQKQISTLNSSLRKLTLSYDELNNVGMQQHNGSKLRHEGRDDILISSRRDSDRISTTPISSQTSTIVKVRAPDDLAGGHKFTVRINGKKLVARVPQGGVLKGDIFSIRLPNDDICQSPSVVKVRAPASMPEGYRFTAKMDDKTIVATVPLGGVKKGEIFTVEALEYL